MGSFRDRTSAGRALGAALAETERYDDATVVLGLPRGGVPVAAGVASALSAGLDIVVVRKLGTPGNRELAMGAIGSGGGLVVDEALIATLRISRASIDAAIERETEELARREALYRGDRPPLEVRGRHAVLVDDGIATGSTMEVAVRTVASREPLSITVAVPVAPVGAMERFHAIADHTLALRQPSPFIAVGAWYADFTQTPDDEVRRLLGA